ncbi:MAG: FlgD immunoglobulin-like domain containing protein [Chloroflexota bacterium]
MALGAHEIHASFAGGGDWLGSSATQVITVGRASTVQLTVTPNPATTSQLVKITARVLLDSGDLTGGYLSVEDQTTGILIAGAPVGPTKDTVVLNARFSATDHPLLASYSGNVDIAPSTASAVLHVTADTTVDWLGMAALPATFYPVIDGYRDTLPVTAVLGEPAHVTVRIKNSVGHVVRMKDLGVRKAGTVSWSWNGRNAAGVLLPAGTYTVTTRVVDMSGNAASASGSVALSRKWLHWSTETLTRHGNGYAYAWHPADGSISTARSAYKHGVRLTAGEAFVGVRYSFDLHAATRYGSLTFRVLGKSRVGLPVVAGLWRGSMDNPIVSADRAAPYTRGTIGPSYRWWSVTMSQAHRNGRHVYAQVLVENSLALVGGPLNSFDIAEVQLVYRYAVLK